MTTGRRRLRTVVTINRGVVFRLYFECRYSGNPILPNGPWKESWDDLVASDPKVSRGRCAALSPVGTTARGTRLSRHADVMLCPPITMLLCRCIGINH